MGVKDPKVSLISDVYGYNKAKMGSRHDGPVSQVNWVGDLMLECTLEVTEPKGEFWMELSRGIDRFRARFDLSTGQCTLFRESDGGKAVELDSHETRVNAKGSYQLRFANFGARLTVWVDRALPFEKGYDYLPPDVPQPGEFKDLDDDAFSAAIAKRRGPTKNDFEPASFGVSGAVVQVKNVRLWRDTYYSRTDEYSGDMADIEGETWADFRKLPAKTYYVQPGHFMVLGDNSTMSSDSRDWGLVPERLMLGRAHMVYFPFNRAGPIK